MVNNSMVSICGFHGKFMDGGLFEPHSNLLFLNINLPVIYGKEGLFEPFFFRTIIRFREYHSWINSLIF